MAYTTIDDSSLYFRVKTFNGSSSDGNAITWDETHANMQPDWLWLKNRTSAQEHWLADVVRGTGKFLESNSNNAESSDGASGLASFDTNGFTLNNSARTNRNTMVGWGWKAGGSASSNSNGSITSSVSASTTAGFSVVSWTGSGSAATIGHSIGVQPQIVFVKNRDDTASWNVYTVFGGGGKGLFLNDNAAFDSDTSYFNNGTASTTTFPVGTANTSNGSSDNMIAYCFANVKGYSKIGSYTGNGNADGTFVYTGFKPAFTLIKPTSISGDWRMHDNKRNSFNVLSNTLKPNSTSTDDVTSGGLLDYTSNGFKWRTNSTYSNGSGVSFIYMCFAKSPFVNSKGVPNNAR